MMLCYTLFTQNDPYERHPVQRYIMMIYKENKMQERNLPLP